MPYKKIFSPEGKYFKQINWLLVQQLIDEGLSGVRIAERLGIHWNSFYKRVFKEHGWLFTYWRHKSRLKRIGSDYDPYPHIKILK